MFVSLNGGPPMLPPQPRPRPCVPCAPRGAAAAAPLGAHGTHGRGRGCGGSMGGPPLSETNIERDSGVTACLNDEQLQLVFG